jgi:hypothetical protein
MSHVDKGLGSFSVIDVAAATLLLVGRRRSVGSWTRCLGGRSAITCFTECVTCGVAAFPCMDAKPQVGRGLPTAEWRQANLDAPTVGDIRAPATERPPLRWRARVQMIASMCVPSKKQWQPFEIQRPMT